MARRVTTEAAGAAVAGALTATAWALHLHRSRRDRLAGVAGVVPATPEASPSEAVVSPPPATTASTTTTTSPTTTSAARAPVLRARSTKLLAAAVMLQIFAAMFVVVRGDAGGPPPAAAGQAPVAVDGPVSPADAASPAAPEVPVVPPVRLDIAKVGVSAPVHPVGRLEDGTMEVPTDYSQIGWYTGLEAPGHVGTSVVVGHLDSHTGPAVFHRLRELVPGDEVTVTLADGAPLVFVVERSATFPKDRFPTIDVYAPTDRPTLRLITCGGDFDRKRKHYRDNTVVYANFKEA